MLQTFEKVEILVLIGLSVHQLLVLKQLLNLRILVALKNTCGLDPDRAADDKKVISYLNFSSNLLLLLSIMLISAYT